MSIINEALKKAGRDRNESDQLRRPIDIGYERKRSRVNWGPFFVVLVLLLIGGPIIAPIFSTPFKKSPSASDFRSAPAQQVPLDSARTLPPASAVGAMNRKAQFGIEETMLRSSATIPNLNLTGIVFSADSSYCILNDQVLRAGDQLQGVRVIKILPDAVWLDVRGQTVTVPVSD